MQKHSIFQFEPAKRVSIYTPRSRRHHEIKKMMKKKKKEWDSSISDMNRYKLTPAQVARKKSAYHAKILTPEMKRQILARRTAEMPRRHVHNMKQVDVASSSSEDEEEEEGLHSIDFEDEIATFSKMRKKKNKKKKKTDAEKPAKEEEEEKLAERDSDARLFEEMAALLGQGEQDRLSIASSISATSSIRLLNEVDDILETEGRVESEEVAEKPRTELEKSPQCVSTETTPKPFEDPNVLSHLVSGLEERLNRFDIVGDGSEEERSRSNEDETPAMPRLLRVCDKIVQKMTSTTLMAKHQQEVLLRVQLEADRWKREYEGLKRNVDSIQNSLDDRILILEERAVPSFADERDDAAAEARDPAIATACPPVEPYAPDRAEEPSSSSKSNGSSGMPEPRTPAMFLPKPVRKTPPGSWRTPGGASRDLTTAPITDYQSPEDLSLSRATAATSANLSALKEKLARRMPRRSSSSSSSKKKSSSTIVVSTEESKPSAVPESDASIRAHRAIFFDLDSKGSKGRGLQKKVRFATSSSGKDKFRAKRNVFQPVVML
eukprot:g2205.t1